MDNGSEPSKAVSVITNRGILIMMTVLVVVGTIAGFVFGGSRFGVGVLIGGILSFLNYFWLDRSTKAMFAPEAITSTGIAALKYILRYVVIGAVLLLIFWTNVLPITAVVAGLAAFAIAVVIRGLQGIFTKV